METGSTAAFPEGVPRYFVEGRFYVARIGDELVALYQKCPHLGCRVPFCESSGRFECPCHGSIFNLKGEYVTGPARRGMDRFPITIEGDEVLVDTGTVIEGPPKGDLSMDSEPIGPSCLGEGAEQPVETPAEHVEDEAGHEGEEMP